MMDKDMDKEELATKIQDLINSASDYVTTELSHDRAKALDYFFAEPRGDEREGYSQVVAHTCEEVVEWALPLIIESFMLPQPARFIPSDLDDVEQARLETEYTRYQIFSKAKGFTKLYTWFKDALISKNGILKVEWDSG